VVIAWGWHRWVKRWDEKGRMLELAHFGLSGEPAFRSTDGGFRELNRYDQKGNLIETLILGANGRAGNVKDGWARKQSHYDEAGKLASTSFWRANPEGRLLRWKREDSQKHLLENANLTADGRPQTWPEGYHRWTARYDARGNQIMTACFGLSGEPMVPTWGWHRWVRRCDEKGNVLEVAYFGISGEPVFQRSDDGFRLLYRYDKEGKLIETLVLGPNGRRRNVKDGWARKRSRYTEAGKRSETAFWRADPEGRLLLWKRLDGNGELLEEAHLTADGRPQLRDGYYRLTIQPDSRGKLRGAAYFGLKGEPIVNKWGNHQILVRQDEEGRNLERVFFGTKGEPAFHATHGHFRTLWRYNSNGKTTEMLSLGPNGRAMNAKDGWARLRNQYNEAGNRTGTVYWRADSEGRLLLWKREDSNGRIVEQVNLTKEGRPQTWKEGHHRLTSRYNHRGNRTEEACFALDGRPMVTTLGFHRRVTRYDALGRMQEEAFFDTTGAPAFHADDGRFRALYRYDEKGNLSETVLLGPNGRLRQNTRGYARQQLRYRGKVHVDTVAFDTAGKAVPLAAVVWTIDPDSSAEGLGLRKGDVLLRYRGKVVTSVASFLALRNAEGKAAGPGEIEIQRGQKRFTVKAARGGLGAEFVDVAVTVAIPRR
jgi:hypothetical protein